MAFNHLTTLNLFSFFLPSSLAPWMLGTNPHNHGMTTYGYVPVSESLGVCLCPAFFEKSEVLLQPGTIIRLRLSHFWTGKEMNRAIQEAMYLYGVLARPITSYVSVCQARFGLFTCLNLSNYKIVLQSSTFAGYYQTTIATCLQLLLLEHIRHQDKKQTQSYRSYNHELLVTYCFLYPLGLRSIKL